MKPIQLLATTGSLRIDATLRATVGIFATAFPGRVSGYYVIGSYADGNPVPTSDLDGVILFKGNFVDQQERQKAECLLDHCAELAAVELDLAVSSEQNTRDFGNVALKWASLLVYGTDFREQIGIPPLEDYALRAMHSVYRFLTRVRQPTAHLIFPLTYPDPADEFYGYAASEIMTVDGKGSPSTKTLINCVGKCARALVIHQARIYVKTKGDCLTQYKAQIGDEWTPLIEAVFERCRNSWHYRIPERAAERAELQRLCVRTLAFENHFLRVYRDFLLAELQRAEIAEQWLPTKDAINFFEIPETLLRQQISQGVTPIHMTGGEEFVWLAQPYRRKAVKMLNRVIYPGDLMIQKCLQNLLTSDDIYISDAAAQALASQQNLH